MNRNRCHAFTLIELLVVMSIISLLIAITAPALSAARRQGQILTCQTRLNEVSKALWAYSVANESRVSHRVADGQQQVRQTVGLRRVDQPLRS
jgi:prepilin-type N-terminal cleavage/methylation domain-containing protein